LFCFVFTVLEFELRTYTLSHSTASLLWFFSKIGNHLLFGWAGFEPHLHLLSS
jgi:hypothetical protein